LSQQEQGDALMRCVDLRHPAPHSQYSNSTCVLSALLLARVDPERA
jgi:hypothetical protein